MVDIINSDADHWKEKYLAELDQLELKEKEWRSIEEMLRQTISRLSLIADERDGDLNYLLDKLRRSIRSGDSSSSLIALFNTVAQHIAKLDEAKKKEAKQPAATELLLEIASNINFPRGGRGHARDFLKKYGHAEANQIDEVSAAFQEMLTHSLDTLSDSSNDNTDSESSGLLGRFFRKEERPTAIEPEEQDLELDPLQSELPSNEALLNPAKRVLNELITRLFSEHPPQADDLTARVADSQHETELVQLVHELGEELRSSGHNELAAEIESLSPNEVLIRLLERLDIPSELNNEFETIKQTLTESIPQERFEPILKRIADLIQAMRVQIQQEKGELEQFLQQLTDRLQEIDANIQSHFISHRESFEGGRTMVGEVNREVESISESVQKASDLNDIKSVVAQRIEIIQKHMELFQQGEQERIIHAEKRVEQLTQQLNVMSSESERLQKQIAEERHQAMIDPLTGIPNRLSYNERIEIEFARWQRYQSPLTIAVWDIDKFKNVNDSFGHQAGDRVLSVVAKLLSRQIRQTDFVARFGGEEFVLLMPETPIDNAVTVADTLRISVSEAAFHFRDQKVPITISCGLAEFRSGDTITAVFERADNALYKAKNSGRNRCEREQL